MAKPFLGKGLKYPIESKFLPEEGNDKVIQDIETLLLTIPGERVMRPTYGCGLGAKLWENIDDVAITGTADIIEAINKYEPRVSLIEVIPSINRGIGLILFSVRFLIIDTNTEANLVFPFKPVSDISI